MAFRGHGRAVGIDSRLPCLTAATGAMHTICSSARRHVIRCVIRLLATENDRGLVVMMVWLFTALQRTT